MELKEIAENHGLTPDGVDYALTQYQIVICEITHGMMSKLSYDAKDIIRMAQERWCDTYDLKKQEPVKPELRMSKHGFRQWIVCGNCYGKMRGLYDYCPWCGKKIRWNNKENEDGF